MTKFIGKTTLGFAFANSVTSSDIESFLQEFNIHRKSDTLYVAFKGVQMNKFNGNNDRILLEDGIVACKSIASCPIDINHGTVTELTDYNPDRGKVIGTALAGKVMPESASDPLPYLLVLAAIWKDKFPDEAQKLVDDFHSGKLSFSMEAGFSAMVCGVCNQTFTVNDKYICSHMMEKILTWNPAYERTLKGVEFTGYSQVDNPADVGCGAIAVGESFAKALAESVTRVKSDTHIVEENENDKLTTQGDVLMTAIIEQFKTDAELQKYIDGVVTSELSAKDEELQSIQSQIADLKNTHQAELESFQATVAEREAQVTDLETTLSDKTEEIEKLKAEFDAYKAEIEKTTHESQVLAERLSAIEKDYELNIDEESQDKFRQFLLSMDDDAFQVYLSTLPKATAHTVASGWVIDKNSEHNQDDFYAQLEQLCAEDAK